MYACPDCIGEHLIPPPQVAYSPLLCARHREMREQEGTRWTTKGAGASVAELLDVSGEGATNPEERHLMTELLLTGKPLSKRDMARIQHAIHTTRSALNPPSWPVRGARS